MIASSSSWVACTPLLLLLVLPCFTVNGEQQCPFCQPSCKSIIVSANGSDQKCLTDAGGGTPCLTLDYALSNYKPKNECTVISVTYSHRAESTVFLSGVFQLAVIGKGMPTVTCALGVGVSLTQSDSLFIEGVQWVDCSVSHQTTSEGLNATSSLFFFQTTNVTIVDCYFSSTYGTGVSLYDVGGNVTISQSMFMDFVTPNSCVAGIANCTLLGGGLRVEFTECGSLETQNCSSLEALFLPNGTDNAKYEISHCVFMNNIDVTLNSSNTTQGCAGELEKHGAALTVSLAGNGFNNSFNFVGNRFYNNSYSCRRDLGIPHAALSIYIGGGLGRTRVSLVDNSFDGNTGVVLNGTIMSGIHRYEGAALGISLDCQAGGQCLQNSVEIDRCNFTKNAAVSGAIVFLVKTEGQQLRNGTFLLNVSNTLWHENVANGSGAAVSLFSDGAHVPTAVAFENCTWEFNEIHYNPNYTLVFAQNLFYFIRQGVLVSDGVSVHFSGSTAFRYNFYTALHLFHATARFTGSAEFVENHSNFGGAVNIDEQAWIVLLDNLTLTFKSNGARFGGAIYSSLTCITPSDSTCKVFGDENGEMICHKNANFPVNTTITFDHNKALLSGHSIFLNNRGCPLSCLHGEGIVYIPGDGDETSAPSDSLTFHAPAENNAMEVWLGQNIFLNITSEYEYLNREGRYVSVPAASIGTVSLQCISPFGQSAFHLMGPKIIYLETNAFFSNLHVMGPEVKEADKHICTVKIVTPDSQSYFVSHLQLNLVPCKLGFVYDETTQTCVCYHKSSIQCDTNTLTMDVCIRYGYWFGQLADGSFTSSPCINDHACRFNYGSCPVGPCSNIPGYCTLPSKQNEQCRSNRSGPLCTECAPGYSFTYAARMCVSNDTCTAGYILLIDLMLVAFWIMMIVGLFLVLKFNLRTGSGYLYAFIYYFSVLDYITPAYLPTIFLNVIVTFFASIAKLNISYVGEIPVCYFRNLSSLGHEFVQYINPLFISGTLLVAVWLARCCPRLPNPAKNTGVHAICILMLLSFSSLLEISLNILDPILLHGQRYVVLQAGTKYFDPKDHLPFALVAIFVMFVIIIPFTFFMIFSPLLMRCGVNLTRIKPILDEYQACYRDRWRWVAGYYFLCRIVIFVVSIGDLSTYQQIYVYQFLLLIIFGFHTAVQPYTVTWLNAVDAVILLDLALISMLYGEAANKIFTTGNNEVIRTVLLHILILIPSLYFVVFLGYTSGRVTGLNRWLLKRYAKVKARLVHWRGDKLLVNESSENNEVTWSEVTHAHYDCDREPLLALLTDNGAPSAVQYQALGRPNVDTSGKESYNTRESELTEVTQSSK